jgi:curved DNA-binding protein CbpA
MQISPGDILYGSACIASLGISFMLNDMCVMFGLEAMVAQLVFGHGGFSDLTCLFCCSQVEQLADDSLIKRHYRKLALLLHPDKNKFAGAEAAFKLVGEAFGVLSDKQKRIGHDIRRRAKVQTHIPDPKSQFSTRHHQQPTHANAPPSHLTFWTSCPVCRTNFEYLRTFLDFQLTCQRCHRLFVARDMYAPHQNGANLPSGRGPANTVPPASSYQQQDFHFSTQGKGIGATVTGNGFAHGGVGATNGYVPPANAAGFMGVGVGSINGNAAATNAAGTAPHVVEETFQKVKREQEAEREAKRQEKEKEELRRQERELQKKAKYEAKKKEALDRLLAKRKETEAKQVSEEAVPRKHPLKKKRGVGDDEEEYDDDEDEVFHPATSDTAGPGLSSNICQAPRRSRRVKRNVMYMLDDSDDDDLEDFPASRKAGMHMATDRKPNGEWRDGMDEANGEQQQKRKFLDDGVESGSNTGDDRMEMGVREMDNKGGNSMAADIKESGKRNWLSEDFRRVSLSKLRQSRIVRDSSVKIGKTGQRK